MKLIQETKGESSVFELYDNKIIKKFNKKYGKNYNQEWFNNYFELAQYMDFLPTIVSYTPSEQIIMEKYSGKSMRDWIDDQHNLCLKTGDITYWGKSILQCIKIVSNINSAFINYSAYKGKLIKHIDISIDNILMRHPGNYCLIDLDSIAFDWTGFGIEPYAHTWLNDMYAHYVIREKIEATLNLNK